MPRFVTLHYESPPRTLWFESAEDAENFSPPAELHTFAIRTDDQHVHLYPSLRGGKGGFGSMLRAQGGRMASQKTTNYSACRDLSGRRLKTISDAQRLAEYMSAEPGRQREVDKKTENRIERHIRHAERILRDGDRVEPPSEIREKMNRFSRSNPEYFKEKEDIVDGIKLAVLKGLQNGDADDGSDDDVVVIPVSNAIKARAVRSVRPSTSKGKRKLSKSRKEAGSLEKKINRKRSVPVDESTGTPMPASSSRQHKKAKLAPEPAPAAASVLA